MPRGTPAILVSMSLCLLLSACVPDPAEAPPAVFDLRPPTVLEAGPDGARSFVLRFDENVEPVEGSYSLDPGSAPKASAEGPELRLSLGEDQEPGWEYSLLGEVRDAKGNGSRFLFAFSGWNGRPAKLRISEVQTAKNSSAAHPHRDFVEFEVEADGNLGGMELSFSSTVKTVNWSFPGAEVRKGEVVVVHCSPEGLPAEKNETGDDLLASGGIDSSAGRDLWSKAGALPDATGVLVLSESPGGKPMDGLFYADGTKSGALGDDRLGGLVEGLVEYGLWSAAGNPAWEDAFVWKPSSARSILRRGAAGEPGAGEWTLSAASAQNPGTIAAPP